MNRAEKKQKGVISYKQFEKLYPTEESAIAFMEKRRWGDTVRCPRCGVNKIYKTEGDPHKPYRCRLCKRYFNVKTDTIFHGTQLPLRDWLFAIHLVQTARKGISSHQLSNEIECSQPSAWHLMGRIRKAMENREIPWLEGIVQVDEGWFGGRKKWMHADKKKELTKNPNANKIMIMGFYANNGQRFALPVARPNAEILRDAVRSYVASGSEIWSDGEPAYRSLVREGYSHRWVNHKIGQYVDKGVTVNGVESFWALMKRGYVGIYHHLSTHHIRRYIAEFIFRLNAGKGNGPEAIGGVLDGAVGRRLKWRVALGREAADCLANA